MGLHHIFFSWYLKNPIHLTPIILIIFKPIIAEQTHLNTVFSHGPYVSAGFKLTSQSCIVKNYVKKTTHFNVMWRATMVQGVEIVHTVEIFEKCNN